MADGKTRSGSGRKLLMRLTRTFVIVALLFVMLRWFEHSQVYHPDRQLTASPAELGRAFEDVRFKASDGVLLHGWFYPADTNSQCGQIVFLICHGNAGNIGGRLNLCRALLATGASVFVFDYRGFGESQGKPGEEGTYLDAQAAHAWLRQNGFQAENVIAYGESLGGGVASELAARETVGGVVLQSTFTSIPDVGRELYPWLPVRLISTIKYDTHAKLPRIKAPVLILHSRTDDLIAYHHAEANFSAANEPKRFCELNGVHNEAVWESPGFGEGIEWLLRLVQERTPRVP